MKKTLIVCFVFLFFAVTTSAQTPTYKELSATAYRLLKEQDYIGAHKWDLDAMGDMAGVPADSSYSRFHNLNTLGGSPPMWPATFKRLAFHVVRWKGWNPLVFYYMDRYKFLKDWLKSK